MNPVSFIFALAKMFLALPPEFKSDIDTTYAEAVTWWKEIDTNDQTKQNDINVKFKKLATKWQFKTLLLFMLLPAGRWVRSISEEKSDDKEFEKVLEALKK